MLAEKKVSNILGNFRKFVAQVVATMGVVALVALQARGESSPAVPEPPAVRALEPAKSAISRADTATF